MKNYRSSIQKEARERILATRLTGTRKYKTEYTLNGKVVGIRQFDENGLLEFECPLRNGVTHGTLYDFTDGVVTFAEHYTNGLADGTAKQWSADGELIGTYTMKHGTGLDLWRAKNNWGRGRVYLSEARFVKEGKWHGFEWWLNEDQTSATVGPSPSGSSTRMSSRPLLLVRGKKITPAAFEKSAMQNLSCTWGIVGPTFVLSMRPRASILYTFPFSSDYSRSNFLRPSVAAQYGYAVS